MTRITLVTGGSRGLGRNTAINIARKGDDVVITYHRRADEAKTVVAEIEALGRKAIALQLDAGDVSTFPTFVERLKAELRQAGSATPSTISSTMPATAMSCRSRR